MICGIKPVTLSNAELAVCLQKLRVHNVVLKTLSKDSGLSEAKFQEEFLSGRMIMDLSPAEQEAIDALTEDVKSKVIAHHIRLVTKIAANYCRKFNVDDKKRQDVVSEGTFALMKALYSYTKISVRFSTFAHLIVQNALNDYFRTQQNGLSAVSKKSIRLNNEVEAHRWAGNHHFSFDEAAIDLGFDDNDIKCALDGKRSARYMSGFSSEDDFSILDNVVDKPDEKIDCDSLLATAFRDCPLTDLERIVMDTAVEPYLGWRVDIGKNHRNSDGKERSVQHIVVVLKRAQGKVQNYYKQLTVPDAA